MRRTIAGLVGVVAALSLARSGLAADRSIQEIQECARKNLPEHSARQEISLLMRDGAGQEQTIEAELFWKRGDDGRSRVLVRVGSPFDLRGSAFLLVERKDGSDMFSYLPSLKKVRRITGRTISGSLFGTDFSYGDIERLQSLVGTDAGREAGRRGGRRPRHLGADRADPAGERVEVPARRDLHRSGNLRRAEDGADGGTRAGREGSGDPAGPGEGGGLALRSARDLRARSRGLSETRLRVEKVEYDVPLSESFFSEAALDQGTLIA